MNYPVWELGFGAGFLIALVAVLHVFVSHFAIGGGFFLTLTEYYAIRKNDSGILNYVKLHSRFFALLTLVFGAITGVGIWFTIGLISPAATSSLIHNFVWVWALEWIFFLVEVAAAIVYYSTWDRVSQKTHFIVGWIYFISAFMSLVIINGILTFMLTPENWLRTGNIFEGFFNPTFLPSLFTRIAFCVALAGFYALLTGSFIKEKLTKYRLFRYSGLWGLFGIILAIPSLLFYYKYLPLDVNELLEGALPTSLTSVNVLYIGAAILVVLVLIPVFVPKFFKAGIAVVLLLAALMSFGASEFIRESVRKPWVIYGYMYGNSLRPDEYNSIKTNGGLLKTANFVKNRDAVSSPEAGEDVFRVACRGCHSLGGYKGLKKPLSGLDKKFINDTINRLEHLRGKMPPFPGTEIEAEALAEFLYSKTDTDFKISTGEQVFRKRCSICHTVDKEFRGLYPLMEDYTQEDLLERILTIGEYVDQMVPWSGTQEEAEMLTDYILSWYSDIEKGGN
ncbi:c-type cytochrome [candidate division KSB1 bacterium]